jgi:hypothetical protein
VRAGYPPHEFSSFCASFHQFAAKIYPTVEIDRRNAPGDNALKGQPNEPSNGRENAREQRKEIFPQAETVNPDQRQCASRPAWSARLIAGGRGRSKAYGFIDPIRRKAAALGERDCEALYAWLASKGLSASKKLHELRNECGAVIANSMGIFAAPVHYVTPIAGGSQPHISPAASERHLLDRSGTHQFARSVVSLTVARLNSPVLLK